MKKKHMVLSALTPEEIHLFHQLRQHPEIGDQVRGILEIVGKGEGPLQTADEVEGLLIEAMRRLGHVTMTRWAQQAEEQVSSELKFQDATVLSRKKKG
jgi:hypothetical protein